MSWLNHTHIGDCRELLSRMAAEGVRVQTCVTSPPYFGLRDYQTGTWQGGSESCDHLQPASLPSVLAQKLYRDTCAKCGANRIDAQIGLEDTPDAYVEQLVSVFAAVREVLADDGTLWLNLGDSYVSAESGRQGTSGSMESRRVAQVRDSKARHGTVLRPPSVRGLASKNLIGIPWRVAFALQADGWYLRSDIIWHKLNPKYVALHEMRTTTQGMAI